MRRLLVIALTVIVLLALAGWRLLTRQIGRPGVYRLKMLRSARRF